MSEDRTQPASPRRRQLAREQGQAAHSPELSAAAGWLAAVVVLTAWGPTLAASLAGLIRDSLAPSGPTLPDAAGIVARARTGFTVIALPTGLLLGSFVAAATAAHQAQVRGLWSPGLVAPDLDRLSRFGRGGGFGAGVERGIWSLAKAAILAIFTYCCLLRGWDRLQAIGFLEFAPAVQAAFDSVLGSSLVLAALGVGIGLADFALRHARFEAMLRTTPDEQREDQKVIEGDPRLRSNRRRQAAAWMDPTPELLAGAALMVEGEAGLTVLLGGGPPPRKLTIRLVARGKDGRAIRKGAGPAKVARLDAPDLAFLLASLPQASAGKSAIIDPTALVRLRAAWPSKGPRDGFSESSQSG